jgi:hypothetical protein
MPLVVTYTELALTNRCRIPISWMQRRPAYRLAT